MAFYKRRKQPAHFDADQRQFIMDNFDEVKDAMPTKNGMIIYRLIEAKKSICQAQLMDLVDMSERTSWACIWQLTDHGWITSKPDQRIIKTRLGDSMKYTVPHYEVNHV